MDYLGKSFIIQKKNNKRGFLYLFPKMMEQKVIISYGDNNQRHNKSFFQIFLVYIRVRNKQQTNIQITETVIITVYNNQNISIQSIILLKKTIQKNTMDPAQFGQFSELKFEEFLSKSNQIRCKVIGTITSINKHKKYIIQVQLNKKTVIRSYKRFSQFQLLYENLQNKYPDYKLEQFPSRFQLFGKQDTRKSYFQNLLNRILRDYSKEQNTKACKEMVETVYNFLCLHIEQEKLRKQLKSQMKNGHTFIQQNKQNNLQNSVAISDDGKIKPKAPSPRKQPPSPRQRRQSVDMTNNTSVQIIRTRSNSFSEITIDHGKQQIVQVVQPDNQFQIKFMNEEVWRDGFFQVRDSRLYIYKNRNENHFKTQIELYRIKCEYLKRNMNLIDHLCEKLQLNLNRTFNQNNQVLMLYHQNDKNKILIRRPTPINQQPNSNLKNQLSLTKLKQQIQEASHKYPNPTNYEGVFNPIGKLFVFLHHANFNWAKNSQKDKIWFRITTGAMDYQSMPFSYQSGVNINQGFLIPISNVFQRIRVECYTARDKKEKGTLLGYFKFSMIEFFSKPQRFLISKLQVQLQRPEKKEEYITKLQLSLENLSSISALCSDSYASQHDGMPVKSLSSLDDIGDLTLAINRILCFIGNISLFMTAFKRNIMKFKYPILSYFFFSFILLNAVFFDINILIREILLLIIIVIIYQQKHVKAITNHYLNQFVFKFIHPKFKNPQILSTADVKDLKFAHLLKYISEDYKYIEGKFEKVNKKRQQYQFIVHDKLFTVKQDQISFFQKIKQAKNAVDMIYKTISTIAFTLQKISNLFCWVDTQKTIFLILILFILSGIASGIVIRIAIACGCIVKMIKGLSYYNGKLYAHNRRFAIYSLRYILQKSFPNIIGDVNIHKKMDQFELTQYLSNLKFPLHDQSEVKKLRIQMSNIMGVYFNAQEFYFKQSKQNQFRLVYLLDAIQTCQTKLRVGFIPGQEGISDEFQQLRQYTKQQLQVDDWIVQKSINFVLNIPSKIFMIYHKKQLNKIEKAQIKQQIQEGTLPASSQNKVPRPQIKSAFSIEAQQIQEKRKQIFDKLNHKQQILDEKVKKEQEAKEKMMIIKQVSLV